MPCYPHPLLPLKGDHDHPRRLAAVNRVGAVDGQIALGSWSGGDLECHLVPGDLGAVHEEDPAPSVVGDRLDDTDNGRLHNLGRRARGLQPENGVAARTTNAALRNGGRHIPNFLNPAIAIRVRR